MYSRAKDRSKAPIRLPDHYSGWAFKDIPPADNGEAPPMPHSAPPDAIPIEQTRDVPPCEPTSPPCESAAKSCQAPSKSQAPPAFLQPFESIFGKVGNSFPFSHGLGFDELLLLGLIVLLAHNDHDPDILLLLGLLLFCG